MNSTTDQKQRNNSVIYEYKRHVNDCKEIGSSGPRESVTSVFSNSKSDNDESASSSSVGVSTIRNSDVDISSEVINASLSFAGEKRHSVWINLNLFCIALIASVIYIIYPVLNSNGTTSYWAYFLGAVL